jgi:DNA modification methylase
MKFDLNKIYLGDALEVCKTFPDESVDCVITSPPYWGLRDYGVEGQMGSEETPEEFIKKMAALFHEIKRVLKDDGTLWLNIGDSYAGSWGAMSHDIEGKAKRTGSNKRPVTSLINHKKDRSTPKWSYSNVRPQGDIKAKDLVGIPWMLAFALRADGWYLRQDIIWAKPNPMPESVIDRCTKSHEYVFLLDKRKTYYFDSEAIKEPVQPDSVARAGRAIGEDHKNILDAPGAFTPDQAGGGTGMKGRTGMMKGDGSPFDYAITGKRNKRSVWNVGTQGFPDAHFATFPEDLIVPMIKAGSREGGVVLDPFMGSGTTGMVARKLQRNYVGIELNPEYLKMAEGRIRKEGEPLFI